MPPPSPHLRLAHLLEHGRHVALEDAARQILAEAADDSLAWFFLGQALLAQQKLAPAEEAARNSITQDPESDRGFHLLSLVLLERNQPKEALAAALDAVRHDDNDSVNYAIAARALNQLSRYPEAAKTASAGLQANPRCDGCLYQLSQAKSCLGEHEEADAVTLALLAEDPEDAANHSARGYHLLCAGKPSEARGHFLEALRLEPNDADARSGLSQAQINRNFLCRKINQFIQASDRLGWKATLSGLGLFLLIPKLSRITVDFPWPALPISLLMVCVAAILLMMICHRTLAILLQLTHRDTRALITGAEKKAASWCLIPLLASGWHAGLWIHQGNLGGALPPWPGAMFLWAFLTSLIWETFDTEKDWARVRMSWICSFIAALILAISIAGIRPGESGAALGNSSSGKHFLKNQPAMVNYPVFLSGQSLQLLEFGVILICCFPKKFRRFFEKRSPG